MNRLPYNEDGSLYAWRDKVLERLDQMLAGDSSPAHDNFLLCRSNLFLINYVFKDKKKAELSESFFEGKRHLYLAYQAAFQLYVGLNALWYEMAIQKGFKEIENRARVTAADYDVAQEMRQLLSRLQEANHTLSVAGNLTSAGVKQLNSLYGEILKQHERISYAYTAGLDEVFAISG